MSVATRLRKVKGETPGPGLGGVPVITGAFGTHRTGLRNAAVCTVHHTH